MIFDEFEVEKSVKMAADVLDEMYPKWEQAIDVDLLKMEDATSCILGQVARGSRNHFTYPENEKFYEDLFAEVSDYVQDNSEILIAFDLDVSEEVGISNHYWDGWEWLKDAWTKAIRERR